MWMPGLKTRLVALADCGFSPGLNGPPAPVLGKAEETLVRFEPCLLNFGGDTTRDGQGLQKADAGFVDGLSWKLGEH
jgi:hypothetical protein